MITLYKSTTIDFTTNGFGILLPSEAKVTEEINGAYELELKCHTINNENKTWQYLDEMVVLKAPTPKGYQLFRVYNVCKKNDNTISVNALHIFYDGLFNRLERNIKGTYTADQAIKAVYSNLNFPQNYQVSA